MSPCTTTRVCASQGKILRAATKTQCSQINKYFFNGPYAERVHILLWKKMITNEARVSQLSIKLLHFLACSASALRFHREGELI